MKAVDEACKKGEIDWAVRRTIIKRGEHAGPVAAAIFFIVAFVITSMLAHNGEVTAAHRQYRTHPAIVVTSPISVDNLSLGSLYVAKVEYRDWFGHPQAMWASTAMSLRRGQETYVVVSRTGVSWVEDEFQNENGDPRNPSFGGPSVIGLLISLGICFLSYPLAVICWQAHLTKMAVKARAKKAARSFDATQPA